MKNRNAGMLLVVALIHLSSYASQQEPKKPLTVPYQYSIVPQQQCPYCKKTTRFIPCTPCALKVLPEALKKFGQYFDPITASVSGFASDGVGKLWGNASKRPKLEVQKILSSSAVAEIVQCEKVGEDSKFSIKFEDRALLMAAVIAQSKQQQDQDQSEKENAESSEDIPLITVKLTPRLVKKDAIVPLKKTSSQGCVSSCIVL